MNIFIKTYVNIIIKTWYGKKTCKNHKSFGIIVVSFPYRCKLCDKFYERFSTPNAYSLNLIILYSCAISMFLQHQLVSGTLNILYHRYPLRHKRVGLKFPIQRSPRFVESHRWNLQIYHMLTSLSNDHFVMIYQPFGFRSINFENQACRQLGYLPILWFRLILNLLWNISCS